VLLRIPRNPCTRFASVGWNRSRIQGRSRNHDRHSRRWVAVGWAKTV